MRSLFHLTLTTLIVLGGSRVPVWAQHMNSSEAPCRHVVVTSDATQCFQRAYDEADHDLRKVYAEARAVLGPTERENLKYAERAWLKYRDANCAAERRLYEGGTAASPAYSACLEEETRQRAKDLRTIYGWRVQKARQ